MGVISLEGSVLKGKINNTVKRVLNHSLLSTPYIHAILGFILIKAVLQIFLFFVNSLKPSIH
jgi:hypothetical protein